MKKVPLLSLLICSSLIITSCASTSIVSRREKISMLKGETGAIISIFGNSYMEWIDDYQTETIGLNGIDLLNLTSRKPGPVLAATNIILDTKAKQNRDFETMKKRSMTYPFIDDVRKDALEVFQKNFKYQLLSEDEVVDVPSYRQIRNSKTSQIIEDICIFEKPEQYAYIGADETIPFELSEETGADYFITVEFDIHRAMGFTVSDHRSGYMGPQATVTVSFYDKYGKLICTSTGSYAGSKKIPCVLGQFSIDNYYTMCPYAIRCALKDALANAER